MTARVVPEGAWVLIRGRVLEARRLDCIIQVSSHLVGKPTSVVVPHTELFMPENSEALYEASRLLLDRIEALREIAIRVQAEANEFGGAAPVIEPAYGYVEIGA